MRTPKKGADGRNASKRKTDDMLNNLVQNRCHATEPKHMGKQESQNGKKHDPDRERPLPGAHSRVIAQHAREGGKNHGRFCVQNLGSTPDVTLESQDFSREFLVERPALWPRYLSSSTTARTEGTQSPGARAG